MFVKSVETRKYDIEHSQGFDRTKDIVVSMIVEDLGSIKEMIQEQVDALSGKFGKTSEVGVYSHSGKYDGPIGKLPTSNSYETSTNQMLPGGWGEINWSWKAGNNVNTLTFYGCNSSLDDGYGGNFTKTVSKQDNVKGVYVRGQNHTVKPSIITDKLLQTSGIEKSNFSKIFKLYMIGIDGTLGDYFFDGAYPLKVFVNGEEKADQYQKGRDSNEFNKLPK